MVWLYVRLLINGAMNRDKKSSALNLITILNPQMA